MADIAFLLLLFFLVATTIVEEKGLLIQLPPWKEEAAAPASGRVFQILINAGGEIMAEQQTMSSDDLESKLKESLFGGTTAFSLEGINRKLTIDLKFDDRTSYESYISVYNAILGAYRDLWEQIAKAESGTAFDELPPARKNQIRQAYPMKLSESLTKVSLQD
jgi:biopolymer transport protein ExbD